MVISHRQGAMDVSHKFALTNSLVFTVQQSEMLSPADWDYGSEFHVARPETAKCAAPRQVTMNSKDDQL